MKITINDPQALAETVRRAYWFLWQCGCRNAYLVMDDNGGVTCVYKLGAVRDLIGVVIGKLRKLTEREYKKLGLAQESLAVEFTDLGLWCDLADEWLDLCKLAGMTLVLPRSMPEVGLDNKTIH